MARENTETETETETERETERTREDDLTDTGPDQLISTDPGREGVAEQDDEPSGATETVVKANDLDVYYGETQALDGVTMEISSNRVTAMIGPSGCGKSTFLRCINRMNDLVEAARIEGKLVFDDINLYGDDVDPVVIRRKIGMVFQHPNPFPKSIYDNVAYGLRVQDKPVTDDVVERALRRAALWGEVEDQLDESALDLSGGQQQRLCIARAIAVDPEVILMDEPASALDPIATSKIEDLIEELAEHYTVVIVTHNMQQAARISDRTAVFLTGGELVEFDDTEKIFENPEHQRVEDYITGKFG